MSRFVVQLNLLWLAAKHAQCNRDVRHLLLRRGYRILFENETQELREYRMSLPPCRDRIPFTVKRQVEAYDDIYCKRSLKRCYWISSHHAVWLWVVNL